MRVLRILLLLCLLPMAALADDRLVRLYAPAALQDTGLIAHLAPRFSLKTGIRIDLAETPEAADLALGAEGRPLFEGAGAVWHLALNAPDHPGTARLAEWLRSEIGLRTVTSYAPEGTPLFQPPARKAAAPVQLEISGDADLGHQVSREKCGRCHAVDEAGRKNDIGSTPSFFVLRGFPDWDSRFAAFYALAPHGAFTQVEDVTEPFPHDRPSPIVPIRLTLDDIEAVMAYVAALQAADLGAPIVHQ